MFLCSQIFLLSFKKFIRKKLTLYVFKSETFNRIGKTLSGNSLFTEEKNCLFYNIQYFFFTCKYPFQSTSVSHFLTPSSSDVNSVSFRLRIHCAKWAFPHTTSAVITLTSIDPDLSIFHPCHMERAVVFHLADFTAAAPGEIHSR